MERCSSSNIWPMDKGGYVSYPSRKNQIYYQGVHQKVLCYLAAIYFFCRRHGSCQRLNVTQVYVYLLLYLFYLHFTLFFMLIFFFLYKFVFECVLHVRLLMVQYLGEGCLLGTWFNCLVLKLSVLFCYIFENKKDLDQKKNRI